VSRLLQWLLPEDPDVLGILLRQAAVTCEGMRVFAEWSSSGAEVAARGVRDAEHEADEVRRTLLEALSKALTTPVDPEDLYWLSERLDAVVNGAKNVVRESEVLGVAPDRHSAEMGRLAFEAANHLASGFEELGSKHDHPGEHVDAAVKAAREIERAYRTALAEMPADANPKTLITLREIYRGYDEIADAVVRVATRIWYAVLKLG
jgi:uncharacterized protein Yka (UPF0111/DUF47 family)